MESYFSQEYLYESECSNRGQNLNLAHQSSFSVAITAILRAHPIKTLRNCQMQFSVFISKIQWQNLLACQNNWNGSFAVQLQLQWHHLWICQRTIPGACVATWLKHFYVNWSYQFKWGEKKGSSWCSPFCFFFFSFLPVQFFFVKIELSVIFGHSKRNGQSETEKKKITFPKRMFGLGQI